MSDKPKRPIVHHFEATKTEAVIVGGRLSSIAIWEGETKVNTLRLSPDLAMELAGQIMTALSNTAPPAGPGSSPPSPLRTSPGLAVPYTRIDVAADVARSEATLLLRFGGHALGLALTADRLRTVSRQMAEAADLLDLTVPKGRTH